MVYHYYYVVNLYNLSTFKIVVIHLEFEFLDDSRVNVDYPNNLLEIPSEVESSLLNSGMRLPNYAVKSIVKYFQERLYKIEAGIIEIN